MMIEIQGMHSIWEFHFGDQSPSPLEENNPPGKDVQIVVPIAAAVEFGYQMCPVENIPAMLKRRLNGLIKGKTS